MIGSQMPFQHREILAAFETDEITGRNRTDLFIGTAGSAAAAATANRGWLAALDAGILVDSEAGRPMQMAATIISSTHPMLD